ncbi:MAG TPA: endo-1,4-beta-xylanase [Chitinophagaceae bacterium]|nr:endo-1,4-beta-xylanase [Chitinophagaceae bacterium]
MKKQGFIGTIIILSFWIIAGSCSKPSSGGGTTPPPPPPPPPPGNTTTLKATSTIPIGIGIAYDLFKNNATYSGTVKEQFDRVTAEYQMKHAPNVKNDGSFDFTNTDDFVSLVQGASMTIHGHTLVWHQNNNSVYLRSLTGTTGPNLVLNAGYESGFTNWFTQVSMQAPTSGAISIETTDIHGGTGAARVQVSTPGPNAFSIQIVSDNFNVMGGAGYKLKFWAKAAANGQSLRAVAQGTSYYAAQDYPLSTSWTQYIFNFTPTESAVAVKFHFPNAGTFYIDDLVVGANSVVLDPVQVNNALQNWITTMVTRYKGKVTGWDVANEVVVDGTGELRSSVNSGGSGSNGVFYWADYLGRAYIADAFRWANAADPNAKLFINDYNLESDTRKLDSLLKLVNELRTAGVPIHGIGIQMHIGINTDNSLFENAFQRLAGTGLLVHVSELDIRINPGNANPFNATQSLLDQQTLKYKAVAESYFRNIPAAQRYGITVWNLTDGDSWITRGGSIDFPTLYDNGYNKKTAFNGFIQGLQ